MPAARNSTPKIKPHTDAFWEALVQRSVTPAQAAPHLPDFSEFEIAGEMTKARRRLAETSTHPPRGGKSLAAPSGARENSCWGYRVGSSKGIRR